MNIENKVCLITGAAQGVGYGLAKGFLKRKALVVAGTRRTETPDGLDGALTLQMNVTSKEQVSEVIQGVVRRFGRIDVLINNAGVYPRTPADEISEEEWHHVLDVNLHGVWNCIHEVIPVMKSQRAGVIINVGSVTYGLGADHLVHYLSSKGGLVGMTRGLARDLGKYNIRVNCLHLGAVVVPLEQKIFPDTEKLEVIMDGRQSLKGRMTPESIEPTFAFFASDASSDITGQCLNIDRGWVMN